MARRIQPLHAALAAIALLTVIALVVGTAAAVNKGSGPDYSRGPLTIATGSPQDVYYSYGVQLASVVSGELSGIVAGVKQTAGSRENIGLLATDPRAVAFCAADVAAGTTNAKGAPEPGSKVPVLALARVYDDYLHLVVRPGSAVRTVSDLRGKRVSIGGQNSGTAVIARRLLALEKIVPERDLKLVDYGLDESITRFTDYDIDAFFWSGGAPTSGIARLSHHVSIRLLPLDGYASQLRAQYGGFYRSANLPDSAYEGITGARTIAVANFLVVRADMDDGLAYHLTRLLFASRDRLSSAVPLAGVLDERSAIETSPVQLHRGAIRYYQEQR